MAVAVAVAAVAVAAVLPAVHRHDPRASLPVPLAVVMHVCVYVPSAMPMQPVRTHDTVACGVWRVCVACVCVCSVCIYKEALALTLQSSTAEQAEVHRGVGTA